MEDIKEKQDYLYREIIQQNYDPEQFQQVMQKHKGLALQNYTLQELVTIVSNFKKRQSQLITEPSQLPSAQSKLIVEAQPELQASGKKLKEQQIEKNEKNVEKNIEVMESTFNTSNQVFHQFVKKQEVSDIFTRIHNLKQSIRIKINSYTKKQQQGLFGSTYIAYLVECPSLQWKVYRRFSDFQWLQSKLSELLPGYPIPPIPRKTKMRSFNEDHLEQRMNIFEQYLNKLLQIPEICSQLIVEEFLKSENPIQFQSAKQTFQNYLQNRGKKITTLKGENIINKQHFNINPDQLQFFKNYRNILHNINITSNNLIKAIKEASGQALQLSAYFNDLYRHLGTRQEIKIVETADLLSEFTCDLGYKLERQGSFIRTNIDNYWTYEERHIEGIVSMMNRLNKEQADNIKKYKNMSNVNIDSENHFDNQESRPFMQYLETRQLYRLKLSFLQEQIQRYSHNSLPLFLKEWNQGLTSYVQEVKEEILIGVDQLTKAMCLNEGRQLREVQYISRRISKRLSRQQKQNDK